MSGGGFLEDVANDKSLLIRMEVHVTPMDNARLALDVSYQYNPEIIGVMPNIMEMADVLTPTMNEVFNRNYTTAFFEYLENEFLPCVGV